MRVTKSFLMLVIADGGGRSVAFLLSAVIARQYGLETLALLSLAQVLMSYVTVLSDGGLNSHAVRRLFGGTESSTVIAETTRAQLGLTLGTMPVLFFCALILNSDTIPYLAAIAAIPFATAISTPYLLQRNHRIAPIALSRLLGAASTGVIGLLLVWRVPSPAQDTIAYSLGAIVMTVVILWVARPSPRAFVAAVPMRRLVQLFRATISLGAAAFFYQVCLSLPLILASTIGTSQSFEAIGLSTRMWFILAAPAGMLGTILVPVFADQNSSGRSFEKYLVVFGTLGTAASLAFAFTAPVVLRILFGEDAVPHSRTVAIFLGGLVPLYLCSVIAAKNIAAGHYRWVLLAYLGGMVSFSILGGSPVRNVSGAWLAVSWVVSQGVILGIMTVSVIKGRQPQTTRRVLLVGAAGWGNVGDDLIAESLENWLREQSCDVRLAGGPLALTTEGRERCDFEMTGSRGSRLNLLVEVARSAQVVIGGGGLLDDRMPHFYRPFYRIAMFAAIVRTPFSLIGIGVGPIRTRASGVCYRRMAGLARYVCVRDEQSRRRLKKAGVRRGVDVVDDPVVWRNMRVGEQSAPRYDLAINLRCWNDFGVRQMADVAGGLDSIVEACAVAINGCYGKEARIALVSMSNHPGDNDAEPLAQLAAKMDARTDEFFDARAAEARIVISNSAGVLAMRLHAALLGVAANTPATAIGYDAKIAQQAARFGFTAVELNAHFNSSQLALRLPPNGDTARKRDPVMPPPIFGNNGGFA